MNLPTPVGNVSPSECAGAMDFCEVAILNAGTLFVPFRYTYFDGYLVILSKAAISNAQILPVNPVMYQQRKRFSNGIGKGKDVCIKVFPLLLSASAHCIEFVLYHEIGHIRNKDMEITDYRDIRKESILSGSVMLPELRADMYAAKKIGKELAVRSLEEILKRKTRALAHLLKFGEAYKEKLSETPVLRENYKIEHHNLELSVLELQARLKAMQGLNIK
jgi:hypothetical protein